MLSQNSPLEPTFATLSPHPAEREAEDAPVTAPISRLSFDVWARVFDATDDDAEKTRHTTFVHLCCALPSLRPLLQPRLRAMQALHRAQLALQKVWSPKSPARQTLSCAVSSVAVRDACNVVAAQRTLKVLPFRGQDTNHLFVAAAWQQGFERPLVEVMGAEQKLSFRRVFNAVGATLRHLDLSDTFVYELFRLPSTLPTHWVGDMHSLRQGIAGYAFDGAEAANFFLPLRQLQTLLLRGTFPADFVDAIPWHNSNVTWLDVSGPHRFELPRLHSAAKVRNLIALGSLHCDYDQAVSSFAASASLAVVALRCPSESAQRRLDASVAAYQLREPKLCLQTSFTEQGVGEVRRVRAAQPTETGTR